MLKQASSPRPSPPQEEREKPHALHVKPWCDRDMFIEAILSMNRLPTLRETASSPLPSPPGEEREKPAATVTEH